MKSQTNKFLMIPVFAVVALFSAMTFAQQQAMKINISKVTDKVYMLSTVNSGNVGAYIGEEGTFIIDDKYAVDAPGILDALESAGGSSPEYLVNTHYHGDHSGGNEFFGERGTLIVAHENVRKRLSEGYELKAFNSVAEPSPEIALPKITYAQGAQIHLGGETAHLIHVPNAHTDTDTLVHFESSNVIHAGDTMFNGFFPFIDTEHGGTLPGMILALILISELADENTKIIPGHGPLASKADVLSTIETLSAAHKRLVTIKNGGASLSEAIARKPLADIEEDWGGVIFTADQWIGVVWDGL